jgi:hypothetical protein
MRHAQLHDIRGRLGGVCAVRVVDTSRDRVDARKAGACSRIVTTRRKRVAPMSAAESVRLSAPREAQDDLDVRHLRHEVERVGVGRAVASGHEVGGVARDGCDA